MKDLVVAGGTDSLKQPAKAIVKALAKLAAQPVEKSIQPIIELIDAPPPRPLLAYDRRKPLELSLPTIDRGDAHRPYEMTRHLL
jgi:hypothetical protein